jgi:hypothetical protein
MLMSAWIHILGRSTLTPWRVLQHIDPSTNFTSYRLHLAWSCIPLPSTWLYTLPHILCFTYFLSGVYSSFVKIYIWSRTNFRLNIYFFLRNVSFKWLRVFHLVGHTHVLLTALFFTSQHNYPTVTFSIPWPSVLQPSTYSSLCHTFLISSRILLLERHSSPST